MRGSRPKKNDFNVAMNGSSTVNPDIIFHGITVRGSTKGSPYKDAISENISTLLPEKPKYNAALECVIASKEFVIQSIKSGKSMTAIAFALQKTWENNGYKISKSTFVRALKTIGFFSKQEVGIPEKNAKDSS